MIHRSAKKIEILIPTIATAIFLLLSMIPMVRMFLIIIYWGFIDLLAPSGGGNAQSMAISGYLLYASLILVGLIDFYLAKRILIKILACLLTLFSGQAILLLATQNSSKIVFVDSPQLFWMVISAAPGVILVFVGILKYLSQNKELSTHRIEL